MWQWFKKQRKIRFMVRKALIHFIETEQPVKKPITKFGGQPVWLGEPQWPISRSTGKPMMFICQIQLDSEIFGEIEAKMAYLFISDGGGDDFIDGTYETDGGENAIILQPGNTTIPIEPLSTGPTLYRMTKTVDQRSQEEPCEFQAKLDFADDPEYVPEEEIISWKDKKSDQYMNFLAGNKIGGTPGFVQGHEFPGPGNWTTLLQLDSGDVPFYLNFGDCGIGYAFLSEDGKDAKFMWQCF